MRSVAHATRLTLLAPGLSLVALLALCLPAAAWPISGYEMARQKKSFEKHWGQPLETRFDKLPKDGMLPKWKHPYAGYIYPDTANGTVGVLRKYDQAFYGGRGMAATFEQRDVDGQYERITGPLGLFGRHRIPDWAGHCNGWTAAAIRHAEPQKNVTRNGVTFTPSDIKGLLAELYTYCDSDLLAGESSTVNPASLHLVLANWIGRKEHAVGMDTTEGKEIWNFPVYAYRTSFAKRGPRRVEVRMNIGYVYLIEWEPEKAPQNYRFMHFHYMLSLNDKGEIVGGEYFGDSDRIDLLWVPHKPTPGGTRGNERGNPYLKLDTVMQLWRASVPAELRGKWVHADPLPEDRVDPKDLDKPNPPAPIEADTPESDAPITREARLPAPSEVIKEWASDGDAIQDEPGQDDAAQDDAVHERYRPNEVIRAWMR